MSIKQRKKDHVELTTSGEVNYKISPGFSEYRFLHNALPEVNMEDVSTETDFLGRTFSFPLFISSMTGGYTDAGAVNAIIAEFCEKYNLPFGVGSQRIMLEDPDTQSSFSIVREKAPNAFIASNIGGAQLIDGISNQNLRLLVDTIKADAIIVHLNPLQELMQTEGDRKFKGIEKGISQLCNSTHIPVIVKETGAGISADVAERLLDAGVDVIDVAGAGGTSWAKVENMRKSKEAPEDIFNDWGIPTLDCVIAVNKLKEEYDFELIGSGGVRSSHDIAKVLCLGADFAASAQPVIKAVADKGMAGLENLYHNWKKELKAVMALLGCERLNELNPEYLILNSRER